MTDASSTSASKRAQRIEEAVMDVEGVVGVRVWELSDRIEIGVFVGQGESAPDVLKRVMELTEAMRAPDEIWDVGLMGGA